MAGVNKVIIVGNLGNNPEIRTMQNGDQVANISVATSESWTDKNTGEKRENTEWHHIVFYRRQAEICGQYLHKGSKVYIEGKLKTRKWQDQNGQDRYITEIHGNVLQMLSSQTDSQSQAGGKPQHSAKQQAKQSKEIYSQEEQDDFDDDIPF